MVETDFLSGENGFFLFNVFFVQAETITEISGNQFFLGMTLFRLAKRDSLSNGNSFLLFHASFLQVEKVTETSWNNYSVLFVNDLS